MKFSKDKCKVLYVGEHDPAVQHSLRSFLLGSNSVEMDWGILVDLAQYKKAVVLLWQRETVGCWIVPTRASPAKTKELSLLSAQRWSSHTWSICVQFWCPLYRKDVARLKWVQRKATMIKGLRS